VIRNATSLAMAMPTLAASAARTASRLPDRFFFSGGAGWLAGPPGCPVAVADRLSRGVS
jgi:hypothetical protein